MSAWLVMPEKHQSVCLLFLIRAALHPRVIKLAKSKQLANITDHEDTETLKRFALFNTHLLNHQVSKCSSCSSNMRLHSKLLLSHSPSTISIRRISLQKEGFHKPGRQRATNGTKQYNDCRHIHRCDKTKKKYGRCVRVNA